MHRPLDLRTLRAFVTVAREGNVTRAADQLHLTQPAISLQLKRLAQDTGITLFRRTATGLELTRDGALLAAKAEQVLASLVDFSQTARHLTTQLRGRLRIGTIIDPEFTRLGAFLKALVESGPGIETELRHGMSGEVPEMLKKDELDAGFFLGDIKDFDAVAGLAAGAQEQLFHVKELARLTYHVVGPPSLGGVIRGQDWSGLATLPWIGTPHASVHNRLLSRLFARLGVRQNVVASVDQEASMLAMVRTGVGLSLCRESIALHEQQANGLVIADVKVETTLSFVCLNARILDPSIAHAFDAIQRVWG
ncbi:LysR family transcriptional regulator [Mesorhizobium sp. RIZ17]|uniref:LysR family transcriptional regulator n=1 Tax=Mesorhizobium sp. RIZ17 TaxID=3132743 RepID=UPI003DAA2591